MCASPITREISVKFTQLSTASMIYFKIRLNVWAFIFTVLKK